MTRTPAGSERPALRPSAGRPPERDPAALTRRGVGTMMLVWTMAMGGWLAFEVIDSDIRTPALVLAGGGLLAVIWLMGLVVLALFLLDAE